MWTCWTGLTGDPTPAPPHRPCENRCFPGYTRPWWRTEGHTSRPWHISFLSSIVSVGGLQPANVRPVNRWSPSKGHNEQRDTHSTEQVGPQIDFWCFQTNCAAHVLFFSLEVYYTLEKENWISSAPMFTKKALLEESGPLGCWVRMDTNLIHRIS